MRVGEFRRVWLLAFDFDRPPGEPPRPTALEARELNTGEAVSRREVSSAGPPPLEPTSDDLVVVYRASEALGCHLALGWPLPAHVLDLHAEFRLLTSGLELPAGDGLAAALAHFRLAGEGVGGLEELLGAML